MNPTVLVTGANGFTGSRLCRYLAERDIPVRAMYWPNDGVPEISDARIQMVPGNLRDKYSLRAALEGIEVVYNIAALYRPPNVSNRMYWDVNVEGTRNIVELAAEAGVKRFVHCSTIGVHGTIDNPSATEPCTNLAAFHEAARIPRRKTRVLYCRRALPFDPADPSRRPQRQLQCLERSCPRAYQPPKSLKKQIYPGRRSE